MRNLHLVSIIFIVLIAFGLFSFYRSRIEKSIRSISNQTSEVIEDAGEMAAAIHTNPLQITELRKQQFPGSELVIEQTLNPGENFDRYIASYKSEGLKIYGLLTVPQGQKPASGWPVIIFNHGFIPPTEYRTTERYIAYTDAFSRSGYLLFRPDYRGHGESEGQAPGGYSSNAYTIDVLNALASVKKYKDADPNRIGMWGHSMGGFITLRSMVVNKDIKAGVIWAGVVASYPDLLYNWRRGTAPTPSIPTARGGWRNSLISQYGTPEENKAFWDSISANSYLADISGPIQLHHGSADHSVPLEFSEKLDKQLKEAGKISELYEYEGDDHNIAANVYTALDRSVAFFDKYVKQES